MENKDFNNVQYDYYSNNASYVKMIMDMIPENKVKNLKRQIIKDLYNYLLNNMNERKISEIISVSSMFREKISVSDLESIARHVEYIYVTFLDRIIFDSTNREKIFDIMNESMKVYVGYYSMYNEDTLENINEEYNYAR